MTKLYKLTDHRGFTKHNRSICQWGDNVTHKARSGETKLCTDTVIHGYRDPILAVMMNPAHGNYENPLLWEAQGRVAVDDDTKVGCKSMTTIKQMPLPEITTTQRVAFGILCSLKCKQPVLYVKWASGWLASDNGTARTTNAAHAAAAHAARAATNAAYAAAARAAHAAAHAAAAKKIDFIKLAHEAMKY